MIVEGYVQGFKLDETNPEWTATAFVYSSHSTTVWYAAKVTILSTDGKTQVSKFACACPTGFVHALSACLAPCPLSRLILHPFG